MFYLNMYPSDLNYNLFDFFFDTSDRLVLFIFLEKRKIQSYI